MAETLRTISDQLFEIVRERILTGALPAGEPIRQDALAAELGVSKIPLREVLARLEQCGLVTLFPNRGFAVRPLRVTEVEEIFALRLQLEPQAVALGAVQSDARERDAAMRALADFKTQSTLHRERGGACNRALHLALIRPAHQDITADILERLHVLADRYVCKHLEPMGRSRRADLEHDEIVEAWLDRDGAGVSVLIRQHIAHTLEDLRQQVTIAEV